MPIKKPAPDAIKKRDHAQRVPACSPRSKVILGLDNQHGIYRDPVIQGIRDQMPGEVQPVAIAERSFGLGHEATLDLLGQGA